MAIKKVIKNIELESYIKAFNKLYNIEFTDSVNSYRIYKFLLKLNQEYASLIKYRNDLEKEYFEFDDNGIVFEDNKPKLLDGKDINTYLSKLNAVLNDELEIKMPDIKIRTEEIVSSGLTIAPADWHIFDRFIDDKLTE